MIHDKLLEGKIHAPFSDEQIRGLNSWQRCPWVHPFTCGNRDEHPDNPGILFAMVDGWHCPACMYTQTWAHNFMAHGAPAQPFPPAP